MILKSQIKLILTTWLALSCHIYIWWMIAWLNMLLKAVQPASHNHCEQAWGRTYWEIWGTVFKGEEVRSAKTDVKFVAKDMVVCLFCFFLKVAKWFINVARGKIARLAALNTEMDMILQTLNTDPTHIFCTHQITSTNIVRQCWQCYCCCKMPKNQIPYFWWLRFWSKKHKQKTYRMVTSSDHI